MPENKDNGGMNSDVKENTEQNALIVPVHIREAVAEEARKTESMRGIILETVNVLYREYNVRGLKYFRMRVEDAETSEELKIAADLLAIIGRFHEVGYDSLDRR